MMNDPTRPLADAATWRAWWDASVSCDAALRAIYQQVQDAIIARAPTCWTSGKCCNFDAYGHRLYVTALEIAWVLRQVGLPSPARAQSLPILTSPTCAYQHDKLCSIHAVRPLGCRIFFCQAGTEQWQHELYERMLTDLRQLHDLRSLPYCYVEWRAGLDEAARMLPM